VFGIAFVGVADEPIIAGWLDKGQPPLAHFLQIAYLHST
jgi:hypothetical protein